MQIEKVLEFLHVAEKMKCNTRHSWTSSGRHESVAEHTFRMMVFAWLIRDEFPGLDMNKVMEMCLFHDFGEAVTGDIPAFEKTDADEQTEAEAIKGLLSTLPEKQEAELTALFAEMDALETPEAKLYKALDKLEVLIQHDEADLSTWLPLEYDLQLVYGKENTDAFPYTRELREVVDAWTRRKIEDTYIKPKL